MGLPSQREMENEQIQDKAKVSEWDLVLGEGSAHVEDSLAMLEGHRRFQQVTATMNSIILAWQQSCQI